jgi:uncharacterized integral membrane protein
MLLFLILGLIIGALAVIFALQNITTITVVFLVWQLQGSLALIIALAVITGLLIGILVSFPEVVHHYVEVQRLRKRNQELEGSVAPVSSSDQITSIL